MKSGWRCCKHIMHNVTAISYGWSSCSSPRLKIEVCSSVSVNGKWIEQNRQITDRNADRGQVTREKGRINTSTSMHGSRARVEEWEEAWGGREGGRWMYQLEPSMWGRWSTRTCGRRSGTTLTAKPSFPNLLPAAYLLLLYWSPLLLGEISFRLHGGGSWRHQVS